jgi:hypothetical protein
MTEPEQEPEPEPEPYSNFPVPQPWFLRVQYRAEIVRESQKLKCARFDKEIRTTQLYQIRTGRKAQLKLFKIPYKVFRPMELQLPYILIGVMSIIFFWQCRSDSAVFLLAVVREPLGWVILSCLLHFWLVFSPLAVVLDCCN